MAADMHTDDAEVRAAARFALAVAVAGGVSFLVVAAVLVGGRVTVPPPIRQPVARPQRLAWRSVRR